MKPKTFDHAGRLAALEDRFGRAPIDHALHERAVAFIEAGRLVHRRTGSIQLAMRAAWKRSNDVKAALAAGRLAPRMLDSRGLLTVQGAAEFDWLLDWTWGFPVRLGDCASVPGTDGKVGKFVRTNSVQLGSDYLKMRRHQRETESNGSSVKTSDHQ
jgi:hypothetical protein